MNPRQSEPLNYLLAALPKEDFLRLQPHLRSVSLSSGQVLYEPDEIISTVYFPKSAMISLVQVMESGVTIEAGVVGNSGIVGCAVYLGNDTSSSRAVVQISGDAIALPAKIAKAEFERGGALRSLLLRYVRALLVQLSQSAACNRFHSTEERLARWLLQSQDLTQTSEFDLTQEFLSSMLGVRRASVTVAAGSLQQANLIRYGRGHIEITDREALKELSCECYSVIAREYRLLTKD